MVNVRILHIQSPTPAGKLAEAELHFTAGPLNGMKLVGFAVWERPGGKRNVTFPARQYSVNGDRRSFSLLRPVGQSDNGSGSNAAPMLVDAPETIRQLVLAAFAEADAQRV